MNPFFMFALLIVGLGCFAWTAARRWKLMFAAVAPDNRSDQIDERIRGVMKYVFGQSRMFRYWWAGVAHAFIFAGFVVLGLRTLIMFARGFTSDPAFGFWIFDDDTLLGLVYLFIKDVLSVLVVAGIAYFLYLRLAVRPKRMQLTTEGVVILLMIAGLMLSDMTYEATGFIRHHPEHRAAFHPGVPAASMYSFLLEGLPDAAREALHQIGFWLHSIIVLAFLNFLPYGKHFHIITVLPNVYFRNVGGTGRIRTIDDIDGRLERGETLGVRKAANLSWKAVLDLYTCTECGRCSDNCPATRTGKLLSPKHLTIALRDHLRMNQAALIGANSSAATPARASETAPSTDGNGKHKYRLPDGAIDETDGDLVPGWINPEVVWACTSCGACEQECPVLISYVDKIIDLRRHLVMERGEFPDQLQTAFRGLESVGNPYSFPNEQRAEWAAGLDVPLLAEKPDAAVLYWVGCAPSFDDRSRKIARATAQLLKTAGVDFAILGPEEQCTGDPARRAGNEYLYQIFAKNNVEMLNSRGVRKIVTTCPHCFNAIANEYPDFGGKYEVVHHSVFLFDLLRAGKLRPAHRIEATIAYHDSCYLGRYNDVYDPPREILRAIPGLSIVEAVESRDRGMCCGAGGAQMWKEEEHTSAERVNHARARQILNVLPANGHRSVATACPFCKTMLSDALRDKGHEDIAQMDVAELLWRSVSGEGVASQAAHAAP
ncbi:MAG: (Fe-S)-binding protein [Phycisphaerales bacterium]|nr:(Fe-S)-binding protein [Phycisphaerales bacterium]